MSRKTRKLIWSAPLVAVFAVAVAVTIFAALAPGAAQAEHEALPGAPINLDITTPAGAAGRTSLQLLWTPPTDGGPVAGYRIDYSMNNVVWDELEANTGNTNTSYTHMGVEPNTIMIYRVFGVNSAGAGLVSNTDSGRTNGDVKPEQILSLTATANGWRQIDLSWTAPYDGENRIISYCIEVGTQDAGFSTSVTCPTTTVDSIAAEDGTGVLVATTTARSHKKLAAATTRLYRVYAINARGTSDASPLPPPPRLGPSNPYLLVM